MDTEEDKHGEKPNGLAKDELGVGILRVGSINRRRSSFTSLPSPQGERHSVTFALVEDLPRSEDTWRGSSEVFEEMPLSPTLLAHVGRVDTAEEEEDDDYSVSVSAMLQRKPSRRSSRRKKRGSSGFLSEDVADVPGSSRRRSSVFTTSSGDTAISIDGMEEDTEERVKQQQIFEKLKVHKEVLGAVKHQPWTLRKKMKLVRQAKSYIRRHEGALQVRLAQSRNTRDVLAQVSIFMNKKWQYFRREIVNLQTWVVPWELRIKEIESHFGSAVASYFIFLRWLFWINLVISLILTVFVAVPEILTADKNLAGDRKIMPPEVKAKATHLLTLWEFEGIIKYSPFFYGWYTNRNSEDVGYRMPLAYFLANLVIYTYSFVAILRKMAENSRMSKLSEKEDECAFSWKLFTGWDFMIGNTETAHNRVASTIVGFKEALLEEAEKEKQLGHWKITTVRILVNLAVIFLLALSAYAVVQLVARSMQPEATSSWWRQNEITVVMSLISFIFPIFFEVLGFAENYHPRKQLRVQLARIMLLNLLNLYSLIIALFDKISHMEEELQALKPKAEVPAFSMSWNCSRCRDVKVPCGEFPSGVMTTSTSSRKSRMLTTGLAAMSLIMAPNSTENSILQTNAFEPRANDLLGETLINVDGSMDYDALMTLEENSTVSAVAENRTFDPPEDDRGRWSYPEGQEPENPQDNYDDYDVNINYDEVSTSTEGSNDSATVEQEAVPEELSTTKSPDRGVKLRECVVKGCGVCETPDSWGEDRRNTQVSLTAISRLNITTKRKLRKLCWETMFGQELAKLTMMDLVLTIIATLGVDFLRAVFVRYTHSWWCWDLEKKFPQYGDFKIAENILHLVNNQGMVWMGMFFSPGLTALNLVKLGILMYLRSWAVMTCNVPHEVVFKASRSNNFYLALLLTMLFLCVLPVGYAIVWVKPSWHCGPFAGYHRIYYMATQSLKDTLPRKAHKALDYIASPGIVIPLIVLMTLIIYYMVSLTGSLREANNDLKIQLRYERTEERRKMFKIAEKRGQAQDTPFAKWKKILPPTGRTGRTAASDTLKISKGIGNILQEKRKGAIERIRNLTSEADETTDAEPSS
ncbi:transmembrane channel-like protein 3, partial [Diachasma alloeum]|uniref:transmembrane channel-like protein 3 n=1 Tax=Diachasma alloeum TaxID=454923 RepID=UPI00073823B0